MTKSTEPGLELGPMPLGMAMEIVDEQLVHSPAATIFDLARDVENWPTYLSHYRYVKFRSRRPDGGGLVEMSAFRPFEPFHALKARSPVKWPTWWVSEMTVSEQRPAIRFRHVEGITKGMEVEWTFASAGNGTQVRIVHVWDGPALPVIGTLAAVHVIGPVFVHGIASRTLAGLASEAERKAKRQQQ
jgi:ribosome-associated toxin RatA of RatAB toxin-antitoxin module